MPFSIVYQDITQMNVDAIVNAANTELAMGGGVCGAIFCAAGPIELQRACDRLSPINTGEAVITPGFQLRAKYIIHTAGPVFHHYSIMQSQKLLRASYWNSLKLAIENECDSIAFPLISSGIYGFPKDLAMDIAVQTILKFLETQELNVYLVLFEQESLSLAHELFGKYL